MSPVEISWIHNFSSLPFLAVHLKKKKKLIFDLVFIYIMNVGTKITKVTILTVFKSFSFLNFVPPVEKKKKSKWVLNVFQLIDWQTVQIVGSNNFNSRTYT